MIKIENQILYNTIYIYIETNHAIMDYSFKMEYKELLECCKGIATHSEQFHGNVCPSSVPRQIKPLYVEPSVFGNFSLTAETTHDGSIYRTFILKS